MDQTIDTVKNLPDISFIDNKSLEDVQGELITAYQDKLEEITGLPVELERGDPARIILLALSLVFYQALQAIDKAGKMNFLKYAYGDYLDNLAATRTGITRKEAAPATVNVRWALEQARQSATPIPEGTRVTADGSIFFASTEYAEIPAGETAITITMQCTQTGVDGNGFAPGEITTMADPIAFISSVANTDTSSGGTDIEDDDSLRERTFLAPSGFSTAGPEEAYRYRCLNFSSAIADVAILGPDEEGTPAGTVDIRILMDGGGGPTESFKESLLEYLDDAPVRPLTDSITISGPTEVSYSITLTYYIAESSKASAATIQEAVRTAINEYAAWQSARIGRDINPDELLARVKNAGAKRVTLSSPAYTVLAPTQIAALANKTVSYGGIEDD